MKFKINSFAGTYNRPIYFKYLVAWTSYINYKFRVWFSLTINILNTVHWHPLMCSLIHTSHLYLCTCYLYLSFHWWEESIDSLPKVGLKKQKHDKYSFKYETELCTSLTTTAILPRSHIFTHKSIKEIKTGVD